MGIIGEKKSVEKKAGKVVYPKDGNLPIPEGFTGDLEALHCYYQEKVKDARAALKCAEETLKGWERLQDASSILAVVAMHRRWAEEAAAEDKEKA